MKKLLTSLLCVVMVVCFMPAMAWADATPDAGASPQGTIEEITNVAKVNGDTITVSGSSLDWYPANSGIGRDQAGWWVGFNIVSPTGLNDTSVQSVKYSNDGTDNLAKDFGQNKDGKNTEDGTYYMGCWLLVTPDYLETALANDSMIQYTYKFDWDGDNKVDQTFTATVDPNNITLNKDGNIECKTENGIMTVKEGKSTRGRIEEITNVAKVNGDTITVSGSSLDWYPANSGIGRDQAGWWVGFNIVSPTGLNDTSVQSVKYSNDGTDNLAKDFGQNKDGKNTEDGTYYMGCWLLVTPDYLETALANDSMIQYTYKFDWDGDKTVDQTFTATVDPNNITLNKDSKINCQTKDGVMIIKDGKKHTEHVYGDWTVTKEATYSEEGSKERICPCGAKETQVIPRLVYIPTTPTTQKPVIESADNATVTLSTDGTQATIKVADGYELVDVTVNGVSKGKVDTLTGLKTGDKIVVTTKKIDTTADEIAAVKATKLVARTEMSKAKGKKAVKVYWYAKDGSELNFDGYEVYRSLKRYEGFGTAPFFKTAKEKYYNTAIKKGTKYYYKVRAYKVIDGEKVYTDWSTKAWRTVK